MAGSSVIKGLKAYKEHKEEQDRKAAERKRPRIQRLGSKDSGVLQKDGDSVVVRFAQELDADSENYNADLGLGFINIEHNAPEEFRNNGNCTGESQGACWPCEQVQDSSVEWEDRKGWKQKEKFYVNVVVVDDRETGDGEVYLLQQSTFNGVSDALIEEAVENGTITANYFKITKKGGEWNNTSYVLTKLKEVPADAKPLTDFELIDIDNDVLREIPYAQQEAHYLRGTTTAAADTREKVGASSATDTDDKW